MTLATKTTLGAALLAAAALGGLAAAAAQESPAEPKAPGGAEETPAAKDRFSDLVERLGDPDFDARTRAYEELRQAGADARAALKRGSHSKDPQVRWSARRLLGLLKPGPDGRTPLVLRFGDAAERQRWWPDVRLPDEEDLRSSMEELRRRMAEIEQGIGERTRRLREQSRELLGGLLEDAGETKSEMHVVVESDGERTEFRRDAEGRVKVSLTRKAEDGTATTEEFEAESMEALAKEHPEAHARVKSPAGGRAWIRRWPEGFEFRAPEIRLEPGIGMPFFRGPEAEGRARPVLGVLISEVPAVLRAHLGIPEREGVVVESVEERSLAERIALQRHDVILRINGIPVSSAADVRAAIEAVKEGGEVRVAILRAAKPLDLTGTR